MKLLSKIATTSSICICMILYVDYIDIDLTNLIVIIKPVITYAYNLRHYFTRYILENSMDSMKLW